MWASAVFEGTALILLIRPRYRSDNRLLPVACLLVFLSLWLDKGIGLVVAGFVPSPTGRVAEYSPIVAEVLITLASGPWAHSC